jgi:putative tryptophan/tyrosine transport system substrate-binding protein
VGLGLVASLARPGANVTGLSYGVGLDLAGKQLQLLKETVPGLKRVGILSNPGNPSHGPVVETVSAAAQPLALSLQLLQARGPEELKSAFAAMTTNRVEAVLVLQDSMFTLHRVQLAELAIQGRLPSMYGLSASVESGGLMSYGSNLTDQLRLASAFVDRILRGARPADMPVEQPTIFELVINLRTAKALGIGIPQSLLVRADQLIQ